MTRSLWRDPVYEEMDEISKRILPYIPNRHTLEVLGDLEVVTLETKDMVFGGWDYVLDAKDLLAKKIRRTHLTHAEVEFVDTPSEIRLDLTTGKLSVDTLSFRIRLVTDQDAIQRHARHLMCKEVYTNKESNHLKNIAGIFSDRKIRARRSDRVKSEVMGICQSWIINQDIRAIDFVEDFRDHVEEALRGNSESIVWLKVLKARANDKEPIYSMELV